MTRQFANSSHRGGLRSAAGREHQGAPMASVVTKRDTLFIGGEWVAPATSQTIEVISPFTEEVVGVTPEATEADIDRAVAAAREAFDHGPWPQSTPEERSEMLTRISQGIGARTEEIAQTITTEMGCPASFSMMGQVLASCMVFDAFADLVKTFPF